MIDKLKDYCKITGRPIATITVDEFIAFDKAYSSTVANISTPDMNIKVEESHIAAEEEPADKKGIHKITPQTQASLKENNNALTMLRSVSG